MMPMMKQTHIETVDDTNKDGTNEETNSLVLGNYTNEETNTKGHGHDNNEYTNTLGNWR